MKDDMQAALNRHTQADFSFNVYHYMNLKEHNVNIMKLYMLVLELPLKEKIPLRSV